MSHWLRTVTGRDGTVLTCWTGKKNENGTVKWRHETLAGRDGTGQRMHNLSTGRDGTVKLNSIGHFTTERDGTVTIFSLGGKGR